MALKLSGSTTQFWTRPLGLLHANYANATMIVWIKWQTVIATNTWANPVGIGSSTKNGFTAFQCVASGANTNFTFGECNDAGGVAGHGSIWAGEAPASWGCAYGKFLSTGQELCGSSWSPAANDTASGTNTYGTLTYDEAMVGYTANQAGVSTTAASPNNCYVAEFALWNTLLSIGDIKQLYSGYNPLNVQPGNLKFYYPLRTDLNDYGPEHIALTPKGGAVAAFVDHPPVGPIPTVTRLYLALPAIPAVTGTIAASTKKPASVVTATEIFSATITGSTRKPAASATGAEAFAASIAATTRKPAASITGASAFIATIAASTKKPASSVTTVEIFAATISASTRKPASAITALAGNLGSITSTTKKPTASVSTVELFSASFAVSTKKPTISVAGLSGYIGNFTSATRKPAASVSGTEIFTATVASTTKKPTANLSSVFINTATIAGTTRKPSASVSTAEIYAATIAASTRKPAANFASAGVYTGGLVSHTRKPTAAIAVAEIFTAAIAAATRKPHTSIAVTNTNADTTATISASTRRPRAQIFVSNPVPKSRPIIIWMT